ncbi:MAG: MBL fold metallo-hydrolase [Pseudonocardiaceae bacterium]
MHGHGHQHQVVTIAAGVTVVGDPIGTLGRSNSVVIDDGADAVVVDTMLAPSLTHCLHEVLRERGARARFVVNTHPHIDHIGGNAAFPDACVLAHPATVAMVTELARDTSFLGAMFPDFADELADLDVRIPEPVDAAVQLPERVQLLTLGPAHAPGDVALWLARDGILIAGDLCFNRITPLALPGHASISGWIRALDTCIALQPRLVVPGHGPVATVDTLRTLRGYLRSLRELAAEPGPDETPTEPALDRLMTAMADGWAEPGRHALNLKVAIAEHRGIAIPGGHGRPRLEPPRWSARRPADESPGAASAASTHTNDDRVVGGTS